MSTNSHMKAARLFSQKFCRRPGVWGQLPHPAGHKFAIGISSGYPNRNLVPVCPGFCPIPMRLSVPAPASHHFPQKRYPGHWMCHPLSWEMSKFRRKEHLQ